MPRGSGMPAAMGQQVPSWPTRLHDTQAPLQVDSQQTPSKQWPSSHSSSLVQAAPLGLGPQLPFTQACPGEQSALVVQAAAQAFLAWSQGNGTQSFRLPGTQRPVPLQTLIPVTAAPSQVPARQVVPAGYCRQAPLPLQVPSSPQVATSDFLQVSAARGLTPAGAKVQVPIIPGTLQALQVSWQAETQQTPSTQKPLSQSESQPHTVPSVLRGAAAARQAPALG